MILKNAELGRVLQNNITFQVRIGFLEMPGLEELFLKYKMDLAFWGHEHSYERFYPIANKVCSFKVKATYVLMWFSSSDVFFRERTLLESGRSRVRRDRICG